MHFQVLTGIKFTLGPKLYGLLISTMFFISVIAFVITNIKKMKEEYKEWKFHENINVNLNTQQPYQRQLNNMKNNFPLFSEFQTALLVVFVLGSLIYTFWFLAYTFNNSKYFYELFLSKEFTLLSIYNVIVPLIYLIKKKKMRKYFWKYVSDLML